MLFDGKLFLSKTNWSIQSIFENRNKIVYIDHGKRPFKFARCTIVLLFELNGNPSLRLTSGFLWGRFASAKRICWFWCPSSLENTIFQQISWFSRTTVAPWQTLSELKLVPPPMDRTEVLHKPSHAYDFWWKITPVQNELVNPEHFRKPWQNSTHCSRQATFQICPLCHRITCLLYTSDAADD